MRALWRALPGFCCDFFGSLIYTGLRERFPSEAFAHLILVFSGDFDLSVADPDAGRMPFVDVFRVDHVGAVDAQETPVEQCLPLRNACFRAEGFARGGADPNLVVVRFEVEYHGGIERDFPTLGGERQRRIAGMLSGRVVFEKLFRNDKRHGQQCNEEWIESHAGQRIGQGIEGSPVAGGLRVACIPILYGLLIYALSLVIRMALKPRI